MEKGDSLDDVDINEVTNYQKPVQMLELKDLKVGDFLYFGCIQEHWKSGYGLNTSTLQRH